MPIAALPGLRLGYDTVGAGPPVLFIMGLAVGRGGWERQIEGLADRFTCITFDNRGVGDSDTPPGRYTTQQMANDALGLLDHLGVEKAHVVGISMGGMIAQEVALTAPGRLRSLALLATHEGGPDAKPDLRTVARFIRLHLSRSPDRRFERVAAMLYSDAFVSAHRDELRVRMMDGALRQRQSTLGFAAQSEAVRRHQTAARLGTLSGLPTLLMHGSADRCVRPSNLRRLQSCMPWAEARLLEGVGHGINVEAADAVNEALSALWARA